MTRPAWGYRRGWLDPDDIGAEFAAYVGRDWPTVVEVADWFVQAEEHGWDIRPWSPAR